MKIVYDTNLIKFISLFEKVFKVKVKDCFIDGLENLIFVIEFGNMKRILENDISKIKTFGDKISKKIKVIEYNKNLNYFVRSVIKPLNVDKVTVDEESKIITLTSNDLNTKGLIIGKKAANLRNYEKIVQRYFADVKELKVN